MIRKVKILGWEFEHAGEPDGTMQLTPVDDACPLHTLTHWPIPHYPKRRFCIFGDFDMFISRYRFKPDFEMKDYTSLYLGVLDHYEQQSEFLIEVIDRAGVKTK